MEYNWLCQAMDLSLSRTINAHILHGKLPRNVPTTIVSSTLSFLFHSQEKNKKQKQLDASSLHVPHAGYLASCKRLTLGLNNKATQQKPFYQFHMFFVVELGIHKRQLRVQSFIVFTGPRRVVWVPSIRRSKRHPWKA